MSDPAQRGKYDADRIKSGLYNPYTSPTAPNPPPRAPYSNFAPPPRRPPPPSASKTTFPKSPPGPSGAYRYASFATEEPSWSSSNEEAKAKTNAARAWAQMKASQNAQNAQSGSFGKNTRHRANSFQNNSDAEKPKDSNPRPRSGYEPFQDKPSGFPPGISRAKTMRVPKKQGFAPGTPGGDEPPARNTSSYFTRSQPQYPPPPPGPPPPSGKPGPIRSDTKGDPPRSNPIRSAPPLHPYGTSPASASLHPGPSPASAYRMSTPYATPGGEKTYFSTAGFEQSSSSHHARNGWPKGYTPKSGSPLSPPGHGRHHSASPKMRSPKPHDSLSNSSCSEEEEDARFERMRGSGRRASADHRPTAQGPKDAHRRPAFPSVKVEDESEASSDNLRPQYRPTWNSRPNSPAQPIPKSHSSSQPASPKNSAGSDPEGFFQHRARRDAEHGHLPKSPLHTTSPWNNQTFERPLEKSKSWQEKFGSKEEGNNQRQFDRPSPGPSKEARPMYDNDSSEYTSPTTPLPFQDLDPFSNQHKPNTASSSWPYWAIPSSITPKKRVRSATEPDDISLVNKFNIFRQAASANINPSDSFHIPNDHAASSAPRKSQSTENINTNFSPSGWHGKFSGDPEDYLGASRNGNVGRGRMSPPKGRSRPQTPLKDRLRAAVANENLSPNGGRPIPPPPPIPSFPAESPSKAKFSEDQWRKTFKEPSWAYPPPPPIQSPRVGNGKRVKPVRKMSTANKRPTVPKPAFVSAVSGEDEGDASNEASSALGSDASSGNAMDIDPALTPPSAQPPQTATKTQPQNYTDPITNIIRSAVPPSPSGANRDRTGDDSRLNLNDLKKTAPFAPSSSGLKDLNELKTTLPFPSAPSAIPLQSSVPQQLELPHPPKAPATPEAVTQSSWDLYLTYIRAYMAEWNIYNCKMLTHFNTRQEEVKTKLGSDWMGSVGNQGYARYMKGVEEDFRVREHWDVSWEKHRECMKGLGKVREKAVKAKCTV